MLELLGLVAALILAHDIGKTLYHEAKGGGCGCWAILAFPFAVVAIVLLLS